MTRSCVKYSQGSKLLHWIIAVIVLFMLLGSFFLSDLSKAMQPFAYMMHKSFGLTILLLMLVRIFWIINTGKPKLPTAMKLWERILAQSVHYGLYVFLFAMPICGWILVCAESRPPVYFGLFKWPLPGIPKNDALATMMDQSHKTIAWILIALICLHVIGALKHYFIDKDKVMQRMSFGNNE